MKKITTNKITPEKVSKYFDVTGRAIKKVKIVSKMPADFCADKSADKDKCFDSRKWKLAAEDFLNMAKCYYEDAKHFEKKGDVVNAFACLNYAHGWLDCGARLGLFKVKDSRLFTVDDE